jgi:hypothetical protein
MIGGFLIGTSLGLFIAGIPAIFGEQHRFGTISY